MTTLVVLALSCFLAVPGARAEGTDEEQQIALLQSSASPQQKDAACARLKRIGTARAVPALAALLPDEALSHSARYALESLPGREAGAALREALGKTAGPTRIGILQSLGERGGTEATPALAGLVAGPEPGTAAAAATALGHIGGPDALRALRAALPHATPPVHAVIVDALLRCADRSLAAGDRAGAAAVYGELRAPTEPEHVRIAALRGWMRSAESDPVGRVCEALQGKDSAARVAALQCIRDLPGATATRAFAESLPRLDPGVQLQVVEALRQRGDPAAAPALVAALQRPDGAVRLSALRALETLADASTVPALAASAAGSTGPEQEAARDALASIRGAGICAALLSLLPKAAPELQTELARALGARSEKAAVPELLRLAGGVQDGVRAAAIRALEPLADESAADGLVQLLVRADADAERDAIERALSAAGGRSRDAAACLAPVWKALPGCAGPARGALLRVAARVGGPEALRTLTAAARDPDAAVRDAAIRALASDGGWDAGDALLDLARNAAEPSHRILALRGYWRGVALGEAQPAAARLRRCASGLAAAARPEERKLGLTELAKVPDAGALRLAVSLLRDETVRAEAALSAVRIADAVAAAHPAEAKAALEQVRAAVPDAVVREQAGAAQRKIEGLRDYVTAWQVAGPYEQAGRNFSELFDIEFPPEKAGAKATWKELPAGTDPARPGAMDLLKALGGEQRVAYVRTSIHSDTAQEARLELGSDDGAKVWVNGKQVFARNVARPLTPGSDHMNVKLAQGWNELRLKVTQNNLGWEFCVRLTAPDGGRLPGIRIEADPKSGSR